MPLEEEVITLVIWGFTTIMVLAAFTILFLWANSKENSLAYGLMLSHLMLLVIAFLFFVDAISIPYIHPMASEEISLRLGLAGVMWAFSMICLMIGIIRFSKVRQENNPLLVKR
nr:hypothetical protein [Neobacillus sp. Marseille-Q6967]